MMFTAPAHAGVATSDPSPTHRSVRPFGCSVAQPPALGGEDIT